MLSARLPTSGSGSCREFQKNAAMAIASDAVSAATARQASGRMLTAISR